jgi:hypothetical protein
MPKLRTLLALLVLTPFTFADDLRTLDNKTVSGKVISIDDKEVGLETSDGVVKVPLDNVLALDFSRPIKKPAAYAEVRLVDDTVLLVKSAEIKGKMVEMALHSGQQLKVPLASVVSILKGAEDAKLRKAFEGLMAEKVKRDWVVRYANDQVNALDGTLGSADAKGEKIAFKTADGEDLQVPLARLRGMIFYREPAANLQAVCMVYDTDGNAIVANKVVGKGEKLVVTTTIPDVTVELPEASIAKFDYNMGKLAFLSDMVPTKVVEDSAVGLIVTHRKDVNLDGDPIVLDRPYGKGLSLHAHTELEYDLKGKYKKFSAVLGVDPRVGSDSQAKVTIEVDGRTRFSEVVTAKAVVPVNIDVTKASSIRIIVTSRNSLDLYDHVTIANPKVTQ